MAPIYLSRTPKHDSTVAALLRQAGAIIIGKSVTTELAMHGSGKKGIPTIHFAPQEVHLVAQLQP